MDKLLIVCMVFSFICGAFVVEMVEKHREQVKGCTVEFTRGQATMVHVGR
jgi:hypothetical protein